jgi:16S rRNA C967 or C1407 C5-methylase (RsmB/RsmF family)
MTTRLPDALVQRVFKEYGSYAEQLLHYLGNEPPVSRSLRFLEPLQANEVDGLTIQAPVPWHPSAVYFDRAEAIEQRPWHTYPAYQAGAWYIQEASGLMVNYLLQKLQQDGASMGYLLDACAAPGGKTLTLLDFLPPDGGVLVASEPMEHRLALLEATLARTGSDCTLIVQNPAQNWASSPAMFDGILVDMPCSGEGMFRKHREAAKEWSESKHQNLVCLQSEILESLYQALRPGGWLIYATCTFGFEENTGQLLPWIESGRLIPAEWTLPAAWNWVHASHLDPRWDARHAAWWSLPGWTRGEGFFCSVLFKPSNGSIGPNDTPHEHRPALLDIAQDLQKKMKVQTPVRNLPWSNPPDPSWAMAYGKKKSCYPQSGPWSREEGLSVLDLDSQLATWYCQGQNLALGDLKNGWNLITYAGLGLGWMLREGPRVRNYFPKSLRIAR